MAPDVGGLTDLLCSRRRIRFSGCMTSASDPLPSNLAAAHAMILAERTARVEAEAVAAHAQAVAARAQAAMSSTEALIAHLKLEIQKLRRRFTAATRSARRGFLSRWSCSWKTWNGSDRGRTGG